jgi:hypothetical protein
LDAALELAATEPGLVEKARAHEWLQRRLSKRPEPGVHTVVWHSQVWHLLDCFEQEDIRETVTVAATRMPLSYIACEPFRPGPPPTLRVETFI